MYIVKVTEHFEDWYVTDEIIAELNTIDQAISVFCQESRNIVEQKYSTSGIDKFISETFDCNDEDDYARIDDWSKGFMIDICNDDDNQIVSQHFDYDYKTHSIKDGSGVELHNESLTEKEANEIALFAPDLF